MTTNVGLDELLAAAALLALHATASAWLLDTEGEEAEDTEAMSVLMAESRAVVGGDHGTWLRAFELSVSLYG
jgi:hypothetical protein